MAEKPPAGRTFEVWHKQADGYLPVGSVECGNILAATVLTMHRTDARWQDGENVSWGLDAARSTTVGDVIVNPEGVAYEITVTPNGPAFIPIDFPPLREQQALFEEMRADEKAGRVRDAVAALNAVLSNPPPYANDNQKTRDDDGRGR